MYSKRAIGVAGLFMGGAYAQAGLYGQCGGIGWSGATTCVSGATCTVVNDWYYQCLPGSGPGPTSTPPSNPGNPGGGSPTTTATGGAPTLIPGYSFIRAVEAPNFHKYLQSETLNVAGDAVLGEPNNAALFQVVNGQLVQNSPGSPLYATVESRANSTVMKLKVSWSTTPATSGTFVWSGDTLEWSTPSISRPQNNAWLICPDASNHLDLYVNLGPYSYNTPAGCADETIHAYTGPTATA